MFYQLSGVEDPDAPLIVLSSGLGGSGDFWQPQLPALEANCRVLVYDHLGTGRSPKKLPEDYSIKTMADELSDLLETLNVSNCHFVGHALGGIVGLQLALQRPSLFQSMVLVNAWGSPNPHTRRCFHVRKSILKHCSPEIYLQTQAILLYPPDWIVNHVERMEKQELHRAKNFPDADNLLLRIEALNNFDISAQLSKIKVNTLLIANKDDTLIPWQCSQTLSERLPNSKLKIFDYGGHACTITIAEKVQRVVDVSLHRLFYTRRLRKRV